VRADPPIPLKKNEGEERKKREARSAGFSSESKKGRREIVDRACSFVSSLRERRRENSLHGRYHLLHLEKKEKKKLGKHAESKHRAD